MGMGRKVLPFYLFTLLPLTLSAQEGGISQKMLDSPRKKRKSRNSLFVRLNRKFLMMTVILRTEIMGDDGYFCSGMAVMSLKTEPLSTVMTTSRAIFTSTVFLARSMLLTVP